MVSSNLTNSTGKSTWCSIRFPYELHEKITSSVPHLRGNFSAQIKCLVSLGLEKEGEGASPEQVEDLRNEIIKLNVNFSRLGNNLNQISHHLNVSDFSDIQELKFLAEELEKKLAETRKMSYEIIKVFE